MRITQEADYAIRVTCYLAEAEKDEIEGKRDSRIVGAVELSEKTAVPHRFTLAILRKLVMCTLAISHKGKHGGYRLARPAENITLRDVIEAIDGPLYISKCHDGDHVCSRHGTDKSECRIHHILFEASYTLADRLGRVTVKDAIDSTVPIDALCERLK